MYQIISVYGGTQTLGGTSTKAYGLPGDVLARKTYRNTSASIEAVMTFIKAVKKIPTPLPRRILPFKSIVSWDYRSMGQQPVFASGTEDVLIVKHCPISLKNSTHTQYFYNNTPNTSTFRLFGNTVYLLSEFMLQFRGKFGKRRMKCIFYLM